MIPFLKGHPDALIVIKAKKTDSTYVSQHKIQGFCLKREHKQKRGKCDREGIEGEQINNKLTILKGQKEYLICSL